MYTLGVGLSNDVISEIKPVYENLTKSDILQKCPHGLTQNLNEYLNPTIWGRANKLRAVGWIQLAVYDAVANYNYDQMATLDIFEHLIPAM